MQKPELNCDLGEGLNNEQDIMPFIQSCSIACGGHAGDYRSMENAINLAVKHKVHIGAHPSYPDRENFGRRSMKMEGRQLISSIQYQIAALSSHGINLHHIKAHGALYNDAAADPEVAQVYLQAMMPYKKHCLLYVPYASEISKLARRQNFKLKYEAFGDRSYRKDGSLVPRSNPAAMIKDKAMVFRQICNIKTMNKVFTVEGTTIELKAETFCIHSDTQNVVSILRYLKRQFEISDFG